MLFLYIKSKNKNKTATPTSNVLKLNNGLELLRKNDALNRHRLSVIKNMIIMSIKTAPYGNAREIGILDENNVLIKGI